MNRTDLLQFLRSQSLAVEASVSLTGTPQAAVIGFIVTDDFNIFFDSVDASRKVQNLRHNPKIAFVIGGLIGGDERTAQYEGLTDEPGGVELERLKEIYFNQFPDGRERQKLPGIVYIRARPIWIRYSDYNQIPPLIIEFNFTGSTSVG
jgi:uncharacterized pyridoxamine 5'-phosphate oxidase family protein